MTPRKRAPGGGRKRSPNTPTAQLTVRLSGDLRSQLDSAARRRNWTLTDELSFRLRTSFSRERDERRDPAMRGLCYLIAELASHAVALRARQGISEFYYYDWRSDPFFYRVFKLAVVRLLDELEPPGPIKNPEIFVSDESKLSPSAKHFIASFQTVENRVSFVIEDLLHMLRTAWPRVGENLFVDDQMKKLKARGLTDDEIKKFLTENPHLEYDWYGLADALRDLIVKPHSNETVPLTYDFQISAGQPTSVTIHVQQSVAEEWKKKEG